MQPPCKPMCRHTNTHTKKVAQFISHFCLQFVNPTSFLFAYHAVSVVARAARTKSHNRINLRQCEQVC